MSNTKVSLADTSQLSSVYAAVSKSATTHKSLDFSNVGISSAAVSGKQAASDRALRQYHQTRIYIQGFNNMRTHNEEVTNSANQTYLISANLPEMISYKLTSKWEEPLKSFGGTGANAIMQLASHAVAGTKVGDFLNLNSGVSGINRATTLKIWGGTDPLSLSLKIPVVDDNSNSGSNGIHTNLVEALEYLGSLCLPAKDASMGFYIPPPSPLNVNIRYGKNDADTFNLHSNYGRIMVQLGGILLIDNCIITGVSVSYPNTKALIKHTYSTTSGPGTGSSYLTPLLAEVTIDISTIEAMTASTYSKMLWLKPQSSGNFSADVSGIRQGFENAANSIGDYAYNLLNK